MARTPDRTNARETAIAQEFYEFQCAIEQSAQLLIGQGDERSRCECDRNGLSVIINLDEVDHLANGLSEEQLRTADLFVLAHECGHVAQEIFAKRRHAKSRRRSREAHADFFAGFWLGIRLGETLPIDDSALANISAGLRREVLKEKSVEGSLEDSYPTPIERHLLVTNGKAVAATSQLAGGCSPGFLRAAISQGAVLSLWKASDRRLTDFDKEVKLATAWGKEQKKTAPSRKKPS